MKLHFYKYQGAGNDFVVLDGRISTPKLSQNEIKRICDRRFGVGSDGLMIIGNAPNVDFTMRYYNANGNEGSMCGNGGRCMVAFAHRSMESDSYTFSAIDGIHHANVCDCKGDETEVCLGMNNVTNVQLYGSDQYYLDTGSPHLVVFNKNIAKLNVVERGAFWRHHPDFGHQGTNVNFVQAELDGTIFVRTYERGVEDETLACGTGVTASAIAACLRSAHKNGLEPKGEHHTVVKALGGYLQVSFSVKGDDFFNIWLTGPATFVFEGDIDL